jgi:A/G-specific adenine glycosylase
MVHFQESLISWYLKNKRDLPWRHTKDPYRIWLSEVILQQTRVNQGTKYYLKFIEAFPTVEDLSNASEKKVLALWQGLGYYSRARNLHAAAKDIVQNYNKEFPSNYASLIHLKGVGPYTAAAIASFSFNEAKAVLDGNVFRVLSRIYDIDTPINTPKGLREFEEASRALLNLSDPATHNQAIMEFGALVCTPKAPKCHSCPFTLECNAYKNETVLQRPVKIRKKKVRSRYFL